jgi:hypothetical protein
MASESQLYEIAPALLTQSTALRLYDGSGSVVNDADIARGLKITAGNTRRPSIVSECAVEGNPTAPDTPRTVLSLHSWRGDPPTSELASRANGEAPLPTDLVSATRPLQASFNATTAESGSAHITRPTTNASAHGVAPHGNNSNNNNHNNNHAGPSPPSNRERIYLPESANVPWLRALGGPSGARNVSTDRTHVSHSHTV